MAAAPDTLSAMPGQFRTMLPADVPGVLALEQASYPFPWSEPIFRDCLRVGYRCLVLETATGIEGYAVMSQGAGEAHILNVCIAHGLRGQGLARRLLMQLLLEARVGGMQEAFLEVRRSNQAAAALYQAMGFEQVGLRRDYYQAADGREDALVFRLSLAALERA